MPNGYDGTVEEWARMEAPLLEIDDQLARFSSERNFALIKNYHNWPRRHIEWVTRGIHRSIQILAANKSNLTFHVVLVAWKDKNHERHFRDHWLKKETPWDEIRNEVDHLLAEGLETLESWSESDLKPGD